MEDGRTSSVYSQDSSRKPTYRDYRMNNDTHNRSTSFQAARDYAESLGAPAPARPPPSARDHAASLGPASPARPSPSAPDYAESLGAPSPARPSPSTRDHAESLAPPSPARPSSSAPASTGSRSSSRPSSRPSFMNYQGSAEPRTQPVAVPQPMSQAAPAPAPTVPRPSGVLLVYLAAEVHIKTMHYLQIALRRRAYASIAIVGGKAYEESVKQLKMEIYGLIGKLGREMGVQTYMVSGDSDEELGAVVQEAVNGRGDLQGVLCSLTYDQDGTSAVDILSHERADLERSWQTSLASLHAVSKATIPLLTSASTGLDNGSLFLVAETPARAPVSIIHKAACDTLLRQLAAYGSRNLTIDYAENVLIAEPEPVHTDGAPNLRIDAFSAGPTESVFTPGESPTKLWNMWALQNELVG